MLTIARNKKNYTKTVPFAVWLLFLFILFQVSAYAQTQPQKDSLIIPADTSLTDTSAVNEDTLAARTDTLDVPVSASALTSQVKYKAKDSVIYDIAAKKVYLYGTAHIEYENIVLDAEFITIDWNTNEIIAEGLPDSTGKIKGTPVFKEGEQEFKSKKLTYNFKSKKGRINELMMQEGTEAFIHVEKGKTVKQNGQDVIFAQNAKYTTCELEDPHFYIQTNKLKLIPKDKIITGPALIFIEKIPVPLVLPFGFFPANSRKSSGIIIPAVGNHGTRGFVLRDGGFYFGGSEYFDMALVGDIYTGGNYRASVQTNYAKRYRFNGGLTLEYSRLDNGALRETPNYNITERFFVTWTHVQNPKAHPGTNFSASVNAGSSDYLKQTSFNANAIREQNLTSSISYGKQFRGTPFNFTAALNHDQVLSTGAINFTLPNVNFSMNRINPFKGRNAIQKRWYHDIGISSNMNVQNRLQTSDSTLREDFKWDKFMNGAHITTPISTSFNVLNYFSLSPSFSVDNYFYSKRTIREYNSAEDSIIFRTENGFFHAHTWNVNASLSTRIYGMFPINRGRLVAMRHQVTPTVTMSYRPDYSAPNFGYYRTVQVDRTGKISSPYSIFEPGSSVAGNPSLGRQGSMFFSVQNNLELKVKTKIDSAQDTKKIKIFDQLNFNSGYNFLADSFNLQPLSIFASTTLFEKLNIQGGAELDPYQIDTFGGQINKRNKYEIEKGRSLGRFTSANLTFSTNLNAEANEDAANHTARIMNPYTNYFYNRKYANFNIPWNLGLMYTLYYTKPAFETEVRQTVNVNGQLNLTQKWRIEGQMDYDIRNNDIAFAQFNIIRDLHCWQMEFQWTPVAQYGGQSYFFNIHIKASSLQDLKLDKRRDFTQFD